MLSPQHAVAADTPNTGVLFAVTVTQTQKQALSDILTEAGLPPGQQHAQQTVNRSDRAPDAV